MRETPLSIYVGLVLHAETGKEKLVDKFYRLGLSISYDRVMQISSDLVNSICAQFEEEEIVCPSKFKKSLFTTANVDNIDQIHSMVLPSHLLSTSIPTEKASLEIEW